MVKTRWWSLFTFLDFFMFSINKTRRYMRDCPKHPNVPPELYLYYLTGLLIGDLECAHWHEVAQGIMKAQDVNDFFLNQWNTLPSMSSLVSCLLTLRLHLIVRAVSRLSFSLSMHTHSHIHIVTIIVYYISWYLQNRHRPEFRSKRLLVPVTQS